MLDVEIRNFQSIDHVHVQIDGFTALVGRSNIGKSAIVRAVKSALTGAAEDNFVRHGSTCEREVKGTKSCKCYCSVHLKAEGFDLLWEKGGDKNEYCFNGQKYSAMGKGTPDFLATGFGLVKIGDGCSLLQVADQFRSEGGGPIFLLDEAGSVVADVLSDVAQLDRINVASRMAEKDRREAVSQRKVREKDVMELKIKVAGYDGLDGVLARVQEVEKNDRLVAEKRAHRDKIGRYKDAIITLGRQFKALKGIATIEVPSHEPVIALHTKFRRLTGFIASMRSRQSVIQGLEGVDAIEAPVVGVVQTGWGRYYKLHGWLTKVRTYKEVFSSWKAAEALPTPEFAGLLTLSAQARQLGALLFRYTTLEAQLGKLEQLVQAAEAEYQAVREEETVLGACPMCAQPLNLMHDHAAAE